MQKKIGRPGKTEEEIQVLCDKLMEWVKNEDAFTFDEFACLVMDVERHTLNTWVERYERFRESFSKAKGILRNRWMKGALMGKLNPYVLNNFYYQLSPEHQTWLREMKDKTKQDSVIQVKMIDYSKKKKNRNK